MRLRSAQDDHLNSVRMLPRHGLIILLLWTSAFYGRAQVDFANYSTNCGVVISSNANILEIAWPIEEGEFGRATLSLQAGQPLIKTLGTSKSPQPALTD